MNFRFLNIPVSIHPTFWIFLLFFTNIYQYPTVESVIVGIVLFFSLLIHEYGHALTALYFGAKPTITLEAFGGYARYNASGITSKQQFLITLNGPLLQSLLIAISYYLLESRLFESHYYFEYFLYVTFRLNILWCLLNLIPITPLDGGHLVKYLLENKFGSKGYQASVILGLISVVALTPYLFYQGYYFFGGLLLIFGYQNFLILQKSMRYSKESPFSTFMKGLEAIKDNNPEEAKIILKKLLKTKDDQIKHSAIESLAKLYFQENDCQKSYDLLMRANHQLLKEGKCLLCKLAFKRKNYDLIGKYSRDIYAIEPTFEIALLNSKAFAFLNQPNLSGAWLKTASQFGADYRDKIKAFISDQTYNHIRDHDVFKQHAENI